MSTLRRARPALLPGALLTQPAEAVVEQPLLPIAQLAQRLHHRLGFCPFGLAAAVAQAGANAVEHALQLRQHLHRAFAATGTDELARRLDHVLEVVRMQHLRLGIERRRRLPAPCQLGGGGRQVAIERLLQRVHQPLDLVRRRASLQCVGQPLARLFELPLGEWHVALFDAQRRLPQHVTHGSDRRQAFIQTQPRLGDRQRQRNDDVAVEDFRSCGDLA